MRIVSKLVFLALCLYQTALAVTLTGTLASPTGTGNANGTLRLQLNTSSVLIGSCGYGTGFVNPTPPIQITVTNGSPTTSPTIYGNDCLTPTSGSVSNYQVLYIDVSGSIYSSIWNLTGSSVSLATLTNWTLVSAPPIPITLTQACSTMTNAPTSGQVPQANGNNTCTWVVQSGGGGGTPGGSSGQIQYNNSGAFGGFTASGDFTINTSTGAALVTKTNGNAFTAFATLATGTSSQYVRGDGTLATTPVVTGGTCTNQVVSAISSSAVPTCVTITSAYVDSSIAPTASPAFTGNPTAPTQSASDASTKLATTQFVSTAVATGDSSVNPAMSVNVATVSASDTSGLTYSNGTSGIGATLTGSVNTAVTIDGFTFTVTGQRLLVKNDTQAPSGAFNGVYSLFQLQTGSLPPIFIRATNFDQPNNMSNTGPIPVISGTANAGTSWYLTSSVVTVGTTPLTFAQFTKAPTSLITTSTSCGGDLTGTMPTCTVADVNGAAVPASKPVTGTNSSSQVVASTGHNVATPLVCTDSSGSATAQSCSTTPTFTLAATDVINYTPGTTNTGDLTVAVNGGSAIHVRKYLGQSTLAAGDLPAGVTIPLYYDGTYLETLCVGNLPSSGTTIWSGVGSPNGANAAPTTMTSTSSPAPYVLTASSTIGSNYEPWFPFAGCAYNACGSNASSAWGATSTSGASLEIDFGSGNAFIVGSYSIASNNVDIGFVALNAMPASWLFQGSNNNSTWTTLDTETGVTWASGTVTHSYNIGSPTTAYRYYRFSSLVNSGNPDYTTLGQIQIFPVAFTNGSVGDWYYETSTQQFYGPRPTGGSPIWPVVATPNYNAVVNTTPAFSISGCSATSASGGATVGSFVSGTSGTCTVTITTGINAPHGYSCKANDITTTTDSVIQTASSSTTATLSGTTVSGDLINFNCGVF